MGSEWKSTPRAAALVVFVAVAAVSVGCASRGGATEMRASRPVPTAVMLEALAVTSRAATSAVTASRVAATTTCKPLRATTRAAVHASSSGEGSGGGGGGSSLADIRAQKRQEAEAARAAHPVKLPKIVLP